MERQREQDSEAAISSRVIEVGSNRIAPAPNVDDDFSSNKKRGWWRDFLSYVGPGFLVSMAYLDPVETDMQAGAHHGYELLWVLLTGLTFALIIQSLAANLGVTTGKHLSELCKVEYPPLVRYCLWLLAEISVIAADIPEVVGTASALNLLFHIPLWEEVLLTGFSTLLLFGLQRFGVRKLELLISTLIFIMAGCFFMELSYVKPPTPDVLKGMFVPRVNGHGAKTDAIALFVAIITPHNLFLHSALVLSRKAPTSVRGINDACRYCLIESGVALLVAFLINVAIVLVAGTVCSENNMSAQDTESCHDPSLNSASFLLKNVLGRSSSIVYGIALLASGQSSSVTGTYAAQYIMQGFLDLRMKKWIQNLTTRSVAIMPSLVVAVISGPSGASRLIIITSMILSFQLPFALIPLLKFSSSRPKMGPHKNSVIIIAISWILGFGIIGINVYYLSTGFVDWLIHSSLPKVANIFIGIIVFPLMAIYVAALIYLTFRKDTVKTFIETQNDSEAPTNMELAPNPFREDLRDLQLPD